MSFGYTLHFDLVTDAASRGFFSVSMSFGYTLNFDLVTDAASRGFLVLACRLTTPCDQRCIAWFPSVSMSFG